MKDGDVKKSDAVLVDDSPGSVCGVIPKSMGINWNFFCDFPGNDIGQLQARAEDCRINCRKISKCTHFVWLPDNGGICYFKEGYTTLDDSVPTSDTGSGICGVLPEKMKTVFWNEALQSGVMCDFPTKNFAHEQTRSEDCAFVCADNPECTHYSW